MIQLMKRIILTEERKELILKHSNGPHYVLEIKDYSKLEQIIIIISIDIDAIKKLAEIFRDYLKEKSKTAISKWN